MRTQMIVFLWLIFHSIPGLELHIHTLYHVTLQGVFFLSLFTEREKERGRQGGTEREGERLPSRLRADSTEPDVGLRLTNCEITT